MNDQEARRADIDAITRVKTLYGAVIDGILAGEHTAADLERVFSPDAAIVFPPAPRAEGLAAIQTFFGETIPARRNFMWHSFSNPLIDLDGDAASGTWLVLAYTQGPGEPGPSMAMGRYREKYVRTPEGWRISELIFQRQGG